jgi:hypothetical protein
MKANNRLRISSRLSLSEAQLVDEQVIGRFPIQ